MHRLFLLITAFTFLLAVSGCSPEIGSEAWCKKLEEKPKGEWTGNEAADYTRHCIFR